MIDHSETPTVDELRRAIPEHCFQRSSIKAFGYLLRDVIYAIALVFGALHIPYIRCTALRILAWAAYGFLQGLVCTGFWIIAHECGHGAFSSNTVLNDAIGWAVHSALSVPYFSWKITHARHHRYAGHMENDTAFVPLTEKEFAQLKGVQIKDIKGLAQDTSLVMLAHLIGHQLLGWQLYLLLYWTGGKDSFPKYHSEKQRRLSHLNPYSPIFLRKQRFVIVASDLGILITGSILFYMGRSIGISNIIALYFVPYLWVHHWIAAITYLHHTHSTVPHYSAATCSFKKGALGTVDRSFGFIGRHFFHDISDHHVVHHLFPKIPFSKAETATAAIKPLLGRAYIE